MDRVAVLDHARSTAWQLHELSAEIERTPRYPVEPLLKLLDQAQYLQGYLSALRTVAGVE
jgi:NADH:ubiquinone oxidoreductase subunit E